MSLELLQRMLWPAFWIELLIFTVLAMAVISRGAVGGIITLVPVIFLIFGGAVVALSGSPALRALLGLALGMGGVLLIAGFTAFLMDRMR